MAIHYSLSSEVSNSWKFKKLETCIGVPWCQPWSPCNPAPKMQLNARHSVMSNSLRPKDYSLPGSSVRGILQARILEWIAIPLLQGIVPFQGSNLGLLPCRQILYHLSHQGSSQNTVKSQAFPLFCLWTYIKNAWESHIHFPIVLQDNLPPFLVLTSASELRPKATETIRLLLCQLVELTVHLQGK